MEARHRAANQNASRQCMFPPTRPRHQYAIFQMKIIDTHHPKK